MTRTFYRQARTTPLRLADLQLLVEHAPALNTDVILLLSVGRDGDRLLSRAWRLLTAPIGWAEPSPCGIYGWRLTRHFPPITAAVGPAYVAYAALVRELRGVERPELSAAAATMWASGEVRAWHWWEDG